MNVLAASLLCEIQAHWPERLTTQGLAAGLAVPVGRLIAHCKKATGVTPYQMLLDTRIAHAKTLLHTTTETCATIATAVGFGDPSQFGRTFRRKVGMTPEQWRRTSEVLNTETRLAVVMALWSKMSQGMQENIVEQVEAAARLGRGSCPSVHLAPLGVDETPQHHDGGFARHSSDPS